MYRVLKSVGVIWSGVLLNSALAFLLPVLLSKALSRAEFGSFSAVIALLGMLGPLASFGVGSYWLRAFALWGERANGLIRPSLRWVALVTFGASAAYAGLLLLRDGLDRANGYLVLIPLVASQAALDLLQAKVQLERRYTKLAAVQFIQQGGRLAVVLCILIAEQGLALLLAGYAAVGIVIALYAGWSVAGGVSLQAESGEEIRSGNDLLEPAPTIATVIRGSWIYGAAAACYLIYFQIDLVLLEALAGAEANALYAAAVVTMNAVYLLPSAFYQKFLLPKLHRWAVHSPAVTGRIYRIGNLVMAVTGVAVMGLVWWAAPAVVAVLWGDSYIETIALLQILAFAIPLRFLTMNMSGLLVTQEDMKKRLLVMALVAVANILLNLWLIPVYQGCAAAWVTVVCQFLLASGYFLINVKKFNVRSSA